MKYQIDDNFLLECFRDLVNTPSPVGYYRELNPVLAEYAARLGCRLTFDGRGTPYITLEGEDNSKTVLIGAHSDTVGLIVRKVEGNGRLSVRKLGGISFQSAEGETVTVHTRSGKTYTGLCICRSHSVHVFDDAHTAERSENTMQILLDEPVKTKEGVYALGIRPGDFVSVLPRCEFTENGYLKSRYIDDKGAMACCFAMLQYLRENGLKPKYRTMLAFPYNEETGHGGTFVPEGVSEYVAVDIGLIGPDLDGNEQSVSICVKDSTFVYDYDLTSRLIAYAEKAGCDYVTDVFHRYGTDGRAAVVAGNELRAAAFGMAVYSSHGRERTHIQGLRNTVNLLLAYVLDI